MSNLGMSLFLMAVLISFVFFIGTVAEYQGFEEGQIAALSGDIRYHLVTNNVKEITWEKIK